MMDTINKLSRLTILLHWIVALLMVGLLVMGLYMKNQEVISIYALHKSLGMCALLIILIRIVWRVINGWPKHVSVYKQHEVILSKIVHWALIIGTLAMPLSGFLLSASSGYGVDIFEFEIVARNPDPTDVNKVVAVSRPLNELGHILHHWIGYFLIAAITLHIVGALKHHILDKDIILLRMLGRDSPSKQNEV